MNRFLATAAIALALCAPAAAKTSSLDCQILCAPAAAQTDPQTQYLDCTNKAVEVYSVAQDALKAMGNPLTRSDINAFKDITARGETAYDTMNLTCQDILEGRDVDYVTLAAKLIRYIKGEG